MIFERHILRKLKPHLKIAILGCTVEFRSLAHKYHADVTLIDISKLHYEILSRQFMQYHGPEKLVLSDWRNLHLKERFDFVFGDYVFNMVNSADRELLLKNVAAILKPGGEFIARNHVSRPGMPKNWNEIMRVRNPNVNFYTATCEFAYPAYTDPATEFTDLPALKKGLEGVRKQLSAEDYAYWKAVAGYEIIGVAVPDSSALNKQIRKYFHILCIERGIDVYAPYYPIHVLGKKKRS